MRFKLDPLSPFGISPDEPQKVVKSSGAVHTGAKVLSDLNDVVIASTPSDSQALSYDTATGKWIPKTVSGGSGSGDMTKAVYDVDDDGIVDQARREVVPFINKTGATLTEGTIVYLKTTSASANYPEAVKANASTETTSSKTIGAIYADTANDATGYIVTSGEVDNLDTSAYSIGDKLWLATTDGEVTTTRPSPPDHAVFIGTVTRAQNGNGRILYAIQNGYELNELHDVSITSIANDDILQRKSGLWVNRTLAQLKTDLNLSADYVLKAGDTMTGNLVISKTDPRIDFNNTSGNNVSVRLQSSAWQFINNTAGTYQALLNGTGLSLFSNATGYFPTHTLTLPSVGTGIAAYNTADQTTNYERVRQYWNSNTYTILAEAAGSGTSRAIRIATVNNSFALNVNTASTSGMVSVTGTSGIASGIGFIVTPTLTASSGTQAGIVTNPTINQSGTAGYNILLINPTESATGSGAKLLINAQVGSVTKFSVANSGQVTIADGTEGAGKVLTSDANGVSSWQTAGAGSYDYGTTYAMAHNIIY